MHAFQSLKDLNSYLALVHTNPGSSPLDDPNALHKLVEPVARCFLPLRIPSDMLVSDTACLTYLRTGALLYMAELRRRCGIDPVMTTFQVEKLKISLEIVTRCVGIDPSIHV